MGMRSVAEKILEDLEEDDQVGTYLALYDFRKHPSPYFYKNLQRIFDALGDGVRIQASVIRCKRLKTARAIGRLCQHYGAEALIFRAEAIP